MPVERIKPKTLTIEQIRAYVQAGRTPIFRGRPIYSEEDIPTLDELAEVDPEAAQRSSQALMGQLKDARKQQHDMERRLAVLKDPKSGKPMYPEFAARHPDAVREAEAREKAGQPRVPDRPRRPPLWETVPEERPPLGAPEFKEPPIGLAGEPPPGPGFRAPTLPPDEDLDIPLPADYREDEEDEDPNRTVNQGDDAPLTTGSPVGSTEVAPGRPVNPDPQRPAETGAGPAPGKKKP